MKTLAMEKWVKHRDRGGVSVHTHTPYFHSEGVSESEGDKPYPRKTQVFPQGNHCHIPFTLVPKTSAAWWRLWRDRSGLTTPVHDNVHDRTSCAKTGRQEGPERKAAITGSLLSAKIDWLSQGTSSRSLLKIPEGPENAIQVNRCLSNTSIEPQVYIWTSSLWAVLHNLLKGNRDTVPHSISE